MSNTDMSRHDYYGPFKCAPDPGQPRGADDSHVFTAICILIAVALVFYSCLMLVQEWMP